MAPIHDGIKRRHFLKALGTALVGVAAATIAPTQPAPAAIAFHPKAFGASMDALAFQRDCIQPAVQSLVLEMDAKALSAAYNRLDVLYGWAPVRGLTQTCRVLA